MHLYQEILMVEKYFLILDLHMKVCSCIAVFLHSGYIGADILRIIIMAACN